jgi:hypothetical protein
MKRHIQLRTIFLGAASAAAFAATAAAQDFSIPGGDLETALNRYNTRHIVIAAKTVAQLNVVGTFPKEDLSAFVDVAQEVFNLRVDRRGDTIVITR